MGSFNSFLNACAADCVDARDDAPYNLERDGYAIRARLDVAQAQALRDAIFDSTEATASGRLIEVFVAFANYETIRGEYVATRREWAAWL